MFETFSEDITEMLLNSMSDLQTEVTKSLNLYKDLIGCNMFAFRVLFL